MAQGGVISNLLFPALPRTPFILATQDSVLFSNFAVNHTELREEHKAFIRDQFVSFLIQQLEANGFKDTRLTIFINGSASATGSSEGNMALSIGRANSIGAGIKAQFDLQKGRSAIARNVNIVVVAGGVGDTEARKLLALHRRLNPGQPLTPSQVELLQPGARSAFTSLRIAHVVTNDDKIILCRQNFSMKFKKKKVPANHLEQVLDDAEKRLGALPTFLISFGFEKIKSLIVKEIKVAVAALADVPLLGLAFTVIEFIVPSEIDLVFEFKDSRATNAFYTFSGSQQAKSLSILAALAEVVGVLKSLTALKGELEAFDKLPGQLEVVKKLIESLAKATALLEKIIRELQDRNGTVRKVVGDAFADALLAILQSGNEGPLTIEASPFTPVVFVNSGALFDVHSFSSPARTFTTELLGRATTELKFLGTGPDGGRLHHAACVIHGTFSVNVGLLGVGVATGFLRLA